MKRKNYNKDSIVPFEVRCFENNVGRFKNLKDKIPYVTSGIKFVINQADMHKYKLRVKSRSTRSMNACRRAISLD